MLVHSGFSTKRYSGIISAIKREDLVKELGKEVALFDLKDAAYIGIDLNELAKWKKKFLGELKKI